MKSRITRNTDSLSRLKAHLKEVDPAFKSLEGDPPLRAELFNVEQMEQHGKALAAKYTTGLYVMPVKDLLSRLNENEEVLSDVHHLVLESLRSGHQITPAGEWLLDNFYLIEDHIRLAKMHLPKGYSEELPRLSNGPSAGLPRVYDIAKEIISHGDGRVDAESLSRFVKAYQSVTTLKIGELWAIPIMLRLALIENLRRVAYNVALGRIDRNLADFWAEQMIDILEKDPKSLILVAADMARSNPPMSAPFVSGFTRRLQGQNSALALPITWIEQRLSQENQTIAQLIHIGNQQLAADQVSISNSISSLRFLGAMNWKDFVEEMSSIDSILKTDPAEIYPKMDFLTRDQYRHIIESISKQSPLSETEIAREAVRLAVNARRSKHAADRTAHVGYYIIDKGLTQLEQNVKRRKNVPQILRQALKKWPKLYYIGSILFLTVFFVWLLSGIIAINGYPLWLNVILFISLALSVSHLAVSLVNWITTIITPPRLLPRLNLSEGIPPESLTMVVVPSMVVSVEQIEGLAEDLEVRYLANQDENLLFGLLTDFLDAGKETMPEDDLLIDTARSKIEELNKKYRVNGETFFYFFHRPRKYNPAESTWMGYERKRGKLADLNKLIQGKGSENFSVIVGNRNKLAGVKYIITLDVDTELPRDSARQMIGTMSHPLNKPVLDVRRKIVTAGYTILQPRVAVSLPGTNKSLYAKLFGNEPGIDPYTRAISDVYQDLFAEGSFIGKGIYEVNSFEQVLADRFPENRILSHDLLEGCYTRSGLLSDILLFEEYPSKYLSDVKRRHRWIRGDWQLLPWLMPRVPLFKGKSQWNPLSGLSWWKLFDNLRRSLVPVAHVLLLVAAWTVLLKPLLWTLIVLGVIAIPILIISLIDMIKMPEGVDLKQHLKGSRQILFRHAGQSLFLILTLPYEAYYSLDSIFRTSWRMLISKRNLLEWNSESSDSRFSYNGLRRLYFAMWSSPALSITLVIYFILYNPVALLFAWPFLVLWGVSPLVIWWLDRPAAFQMPKLTEDQYKFLFGLSRRTWAFFESFVTEKDNWLPPDNFQVHPNTVIAHRTSPTNIGLSLLANLAAYDFGYIPVGELLDRTANALNTIDKLERYHGHFYNWYNTQSLKPLAPLYISSVDSGNLAGDVMTLRSGLTDLPDKPVLNSRFTEGLRDTLDMILSNYTGAYPDTVQKFRTILNTYIMQPPANLDEAWECVSKLAEVSNEILWRMPYSPDSDMEEWARRLDKQCRNAVSELQYLAPWVVGASHENVPSFNGIPTLRQIANMDHEHSRHAADRIEFISSLIDNLSGIIQMKYDFLYDKSRNLQSIGFNVEDHRLDASFYDLLASEARLSSFVAIARGEVPQESWFALSRILTGSDGEAILLSWSGSMFEYLMPLIIMPVYENTLIYKACVNAILKQIEYGREHDIPWGISESGYNMFDLNLNYQYRAFGVPGLGLKRGLSDDLVIAPYATALALLLRPREACKNLERLASEGFMGKYGFYEAVDYTPSRLPRGQAYVIVKSYMSHHQGMSLLALSGFLLDRPMQKRFESDALLQASLLLLHERIPRYSSFHDFSDSEINIKSSIGLQEMPIRVYDTAYTPYPEVHLLSNGRYQVMLTNAGGGYSRWNDLAVTRWREDSTSDNWGTFCYIRDAESGTFWSAAYQPTLAKPDRYEVVFSEGRAEFKRRDQDIDTYTEIVVSPEDDIELRRVHLKNRSRMRRVIDIISYAEPVLIPPAAEMTHPSFNNLFIQTEIVYQRQAILVTRRPRAAGEEIPWMFHQMAAHGTEILNITYETDRLVFLGRGNTPERPHALTVYKSLTNTEGSVLDPVASIQYQIVLEPEGTATVDMVTGMSGSRENAMAMVEKYQDQQLANRVFEMAWTHGQVMLQQINAVESDARLYGRLASNIIYANRSLRSESSVIMRNKRGQSGLWGYSISGDLPILLVQIEDPDNINLIRQLIQAHAYWRLKGLSVDMVIWVEDYAGYRQPLHEQIMGIIAGGIEANIVGRPGGIFVRAGDQLSAEDRALFQGVARVVISDRNGNLAEQLNRRVSFDPVIAAFKPGRMFNPEIRTEPGETKHNLEFFNGTGGFTPDGREYIIYTSAGTMTPVPWSNVLANARFGTVISENGQAYTWSENAHEFRLTAWNNDFVSDRGGETIYIRDEETGHFWSPTPFIKNGSAVYKTRHGFGYTIFEHIETGIYTELCVYVSLEAPVKFSVLKIRNFSGQSRRLSVTGYVEWVLGDLRTKTALHVNTEIDIDSSAIYARNPYNFEFAERAAFFQTNDSSACSFTCDRTEFLGRNSSMSKPAAMNRSRLSGKRGAALDPCAAIQVTLQVENEQEAEVVFSLGSGRNTEETLSLAQQFLSRSAARLELENVWDYWKNTLGRVQVVTPDRAFNYMANGWLLYQTLTSRLWARSGYYQSGGAYGFRDQLQDAMAVVLSDTQILRDQIILHASRQFVEGDVQHWWHPPTGRGVRTLCSDDYLWLPFAVCRYVTCTGDVSILDVPVHYLEGRPLNAEEESYYDLPNQSLEKGSVYEHCKRAIERGLRFGSHGLPLIGSHDWNDGMNKIGHKGKGESIWLGFFLYDILVQFKELSGNYGDTDFAGRCDEEAGLLKANLELHGWDGKWYLRAYFDDGTPLGSQANDECKIDSLSQSWSVISGAGNPNRTNIAMESVNSILVRRDKGLVQLLDPAFDKSDLDPGYIKGYVPGVRENGGQYTHAAIWVIMAFAKLGDKKRAWEIFSMINPVNHARTPGETETYKVEPYVVAADVYSMPPHTGRGGWTWYTGSAGWMYRMITESLLGMRIESDKLYLEPLLPDDWNSFGLEYKYFDTFYRITVQRADDKNTVPGLFIDGTPGNKKFVPLLNDRIDHEVRLVLSLQSTSS